MMGEVPEETKRIIQRSVIAARKRIEAEDQYAKINDESRERALNILSYAYNLPEIWGETYQLLLVMIPKMEMADHRGNWIPYLERGEVISQAIKDIAGHGELCLAIGYLELSRAQLQDAETWFRQSHQSFIQIGDEPSQGRVLNRLALTQLDNQNYNTSFELVNQALVLLDNEDVEIANCHYVLGSICGAERRWSGAERHYRISLRIWEQIVDIRRIAWGLRNLGIALHAQDDYEEAVSCYKKALNIFDRVSDPANKAKVQNNLGITFWKCRYFDDAANIFIEAQKSFRIFEDELNLARVALNLGINYAATSKWMLAQSAYHESIKLWKQLGINASLCNTLDCLGETYLATNEYTKASEIFQKGLNILEKIPNHPRYEYLKDMLTNHLDQAKQQ